MAKVQMKRSDALDWIHAQLGEWVYDEDPEDEDPDDPNIRFVTLSNTELYNVFCQSGLLHQAYNSEDGASEDNFEIVD
jgi:hypothetical protein